MAKHVKRFFRTNTLSACAGVVVLFLVIVSILAPVLPIRDPLWVEFTALRVPPGKHDAFYLFGTDNIGRDIFSRIIYGGRASLFVALTTVVLGCSIGFVWGLSTAYLGGKVDLTSQRLMEILLSIPGLLLALSFAVVLRPSIWTVILAISLTLAAPVGRVIRSVVLSVKEMPFIEATVTVGSSPTRVMFAHIAPQCGAPMLILMTANLGGVILTEAALTFLGLGIPPPTPTWGNMLGESRLFLRPDWWMVMFPGLAITLAVLAFNLLGDGLRDMLDPRLRGTT